MALRSLRCRRWGHRWAVTDGDFRLLVQVCRRWECPAQRADPQLPDELFVRLQAHLYDWARHYRRGRPDWSDRD